MSIFIRSFQQHFDPFSPVVYHHDIKCVNIEGLSVPKFLRPPRSTPLAKNVKNTIN